MHLKSMQMGDLNNLLSTEAFYLHEKRAYVYGEELFLNFAQL